MPAVRFSRSRVARLSVGRGILDWQQIRGVKRIALKCRKERGTMRLGSLFESARILSIVELQLTAETFLRCGYSSDISSYHIRLIFKLISQEFTYPVTQLSQLIDVKIMQYISSTRLDSNIYIYASNFSLKIYTSDMYICIHIINVYFFYLQIILLTYTSSL